MCSSFAQRYSAQSSFGFWTSNTSSARTRISPIRACAASSSANEGGAVACGCARAATGKAAPSATAQVATSRRVRRHNPLR
jgi:hypothetical protein